VATIKKIAFSKNFLAEGFVAWGCDSDLRLVHRSTVAFAFAYVRLAHWFPALRADARIILVIRTFVGDTNFTFMLAIRFGSSVFGAIFVVISFTHGCILLFKYPLMVFLRVSLVNPENRRGGDPFLLLTQKKKRAKIRSQ